MPWSSVSAKRSSSFLQHFLDMRLRLDELRIGVAHLDAERLDQDGGKKVSSTPSFLPWRIGATNDASQDVTPPSLPGSTPSVTRNAQARI